MFEIIWNIKACRDYAISNQHIPHNKIHQSVEPCKPKVLFSIQKYTQKAPSMKIQPSLEKD